MSRDAGGRFGFNNTIATGRPKGSRNLETHWKRQLHSEHGEAAMKKIVEHMNGEDKRISARASEFIINSGRREIDEPVCLELPEIHTMDDARKALNVVSQAMANGEISARKARDMMATIEAQWRVLLACDIEVKVEELQEIAAEFARLKQAIEQAKKE